MKLLHHYMPHTISLMAVAATVALLISYRTSHNNYVRTTEATSYSGMWTAAMRDLAFEDATAAPQSPCPALATHHERGQHDTYTFSTIITRAQEPTHEMNEPLATCDESPYYLLRTTIGWDQNPIALRIVQVVNADTAKDNPQLLMRSHLRQEAPKFTITALEGPP